MVKADRNSVVATIAGQVNMPQGVSTVKWSWTDDNGEIHTHLINHVYYFPASPINILGVTVFARQLGNKELMGVDTKWKTSTFYWKGGYKRTLQHPISQLPEMALAKLDDNQFANFVNDFKERLDTSISFHNASCHTCSKSCTSPLPVFQCIDIEMSEFVVGEWLFYANDGHNLMVVLKDVQNLEDGTNIMTVELPNKKLIDTTASCLHAPS